MNLHHFELYGKSGELESLSGDLFDIIENIGFPVNKVRINADDFICSGEIDQKIKIKIKYYSEKIISHFWYVDDIIVEEKYTEFYLRRYNIPDNVTIKNLCLSNYASTSIWSYKVRNVSILHLQKILAINKNLIVKRLNTDFMFPEGIQEFLDQFTKIQILIMNSAKISFLDQEAFSKIEIQEVVIELIRDINIDVILANQHIKKIVLSGEYNVTCNSDNILSVEDIIFRYATLNSSQDLPEKVVDNKCNLDNFFRFKRVKPVM